MTGRASIPLRPITMPEFATVDHVILTGPSIKEPGAPVVDAPPIEGGGKDETHVVLWYAEHGLQMPALPDNMTITFRSNLELPKGVGMACGGRHLREMENRGGPIGPRKPLPLPAIPGVLS